MSIFVQREGFTNNRAMWSSILSTMSANGFDIVSVNKQKGSSSPIPDKVDNFVVSATANVDPVAVDQPWRICVNVTDNSTEIYVAAPQQISDEGVVSVAYTSGATSTLREHYSGCLGGCLSNIKAPVEERKDFFFHRGIAGSTGIPGSMVFLDSDSNANPKPPVSELLVDASWESTPMTYVLAISDHGIALHTSIEGRDDEGCRQAWFCVQRAINSDGTVVTEGKAPLFALWSVNGGGSENNRYLWEDGIQRMTIREADVNVPARPVSAVKHSYDAFAVMNPLQQVPFSEDGRFDFRLPQGFNTQRHSYPFEIDMVGYASADVISSRISIDIQVYGEVEGGNPKTRKYMALSANSPKNTGMRIFMLQEGGGIAPASNA